MARQVARAISGAGARPPDLRRRRLSLVAGRSAGDSALVISPRFTIDLPCGVDSPTTERPGGGDDPKVQHSGQRCVGFRIRANANGRAERGFRAGRACGPWMLEGPKSSSEVGGLASCFIRFPTAADVRRVYADWARQSSPEATLTYPAETDYGLLEAGLTDPDGNLLRLGGALKT